jgi:hypothetical protein
MGCLHFGRQTLKTQGSAIPTTLTSECIILTYERILGECERVMGSKVGHIAVRTVAELSMAVADRRPLLDSGSVRADEGEGSGSDCGEEHGNVANRSGNVRESL